MINVSIWQKAGNQAFTYLDSKAFFGKAGEIHFIKGVLSGDTNGDKVADFEILITLVGGTTLVSQDVIFKTQII
jgi:serralysin